MKLVHMELVDANAFVARRHRHHKPVQGHRFSLGAEHTGALCGVAIVGRPQARMTDQRTVVEVLRLCTDGKKNACSFLYSACARAAASLGYRRIQTFILESESGTSLKASGWSIDHTTSGGEWSRPSRERRAVDSAVPKQRWSKTL